MADLLQTAYERALAYQQGLTGRPVFPDAAALAQLAQFDEALPQSPQDPQHTLEHLDRYGSPATVGTTGGRYFGFVTGGALPVAQASNWLATTWDQNGALFTLSPIVSKLESVVLRWLADLFALPSDVAGAFLSGATMANFTALAAARQALLARQGWDVAADGLFGAPPITVVVGDEVHVSVLKALSLLGLGHSRVIRVPVDEQGRMLPQELPALDAATLICVQAGNVNSGAFDPIRAICEQAQAAGAWVHVDGAFGMWAGVVDSLAHLCDGVTLADSWTLDAHKWLNVPYDSGIALCRHPEVLKAAMSVAAPYLTPSAQRDPSNFGPEFSRCARVVDVWAVLRSLGRSGLADMIEQHCAFARHFAAGLRDAGYSVHNDVVLNQVVVSFGDAVRTQAVIAAIQADGTLWAGQTVWQGQTAMRISVSSWATTEADIELSLATILRLAAG